MREGLTKQHTTSLHACAGLTTDHHVCLKKVFGAPNHTRTRPLTKHARSVLSSFIFAFMVLGPTTATYLVLKDFEEATGLATQGGRLEDILFLFALVHSRIKVRGADGQENIFAVLLRILKGIIRMGGGFRGGLWFCLYPQDEWSGLRNVLCRYLMSHHPRIERSWLLGIGLLIRSRALCLCSTPNLGCALLCHGCCQTGLSIFLFAPLCSCLQTIRFSILRFRQAVFSRPSQRNTAFPVARL